MRSPIALLVLVAACTRPGEDRPAFEVDIGIASTSDATVRVGNGLAAVRDLSDFRLELWSQSPVLDVELVLGSTAAGPWTIVVRNSLVDATLSIGGVTYTRETGDRSTVATFKVTLTDGTHAMRVAPPDVDTVESYRVAAMADIQTALPEVDDVFRAISAVPDVRFVIAMGDLTQRGEIEEYDLFEQQLETLSVPFYTTLGNHELWAPAERFLDRFGRANFQFQFKGAAFTFVDSGNAGIDPIVEDWLAGWLDTAQAQTHVFLTHFPPVDPAGIRYGAFRSSRDGHRLLSQLADQRVDLTLYGHLHTYIAYENAGIPAFISGGGGAQPMQGDGIDRHFLVVELAPAANTIGSIELHRVD